MKTYLDKTAWMALGAGCAMLVSGIATAQQIDKGDLGSYERHGRFVHRVNDGGPSGGSSSAQATSSATETRPEGVVYDKGELGTWVRDGKFVRKVRDVSSSPSSTTRPAAKREGKVLDHKTHRHNLP